jgi:hypothetical protein
VLSPTRTDTSVGSVLATQSGTYGGIDGGRASPTPPPAAAPCAFFPSDHIWNTPIQDLPVDPFSAEYVAAIGADSPLHPDFGSGFWEGQPIGIPFIQLAAAPELVPVAFEYADESDPGPYPIPPDAPIEGGSGSDGDRHILMVDLAGCRLYEMYSAYPEGDGSWRAGSGAVFDLSGYALRPPDWTSADAAGLPIFPGLVRYEETAAGEILHALRFTAPDTRRAYVWPARHFASDSDDPRLPAMGQRFRLRADFDLSPFSPAARAILRALQAYGMMLADNGSPWFLSGAPDERWDNDRLRELRQVRGRDFEAVDVSSLMVDEDQGLARTGAGP